MKRGKEFNNVLDECLERLLVKGETLEQCLRSYPEYAAELEPLLQTALATKQALIIQPRPEFKTKARYQFRLALQEVKPKRRFFLGWQPRWATAVATILVLLLAGSGTVVAAGNSMPDNPLYPVKLATEQVRLTLTRSNMGKAELYAKLADKRVAEIIYMADKGDARQVEVTTQRLDERLVMLARLTSALKAGATPEALAPLPTPVPSEAARGGKDVHVGANRRAELRVTVAHCAVNHQARLHAALEKAPESAKPALRRAIAVSLAGYEKALEALD